MRENMGLYHGKRVDNGKWVEGYFFETNTPVYRAFIITNMSVDITDGCTDILGFNIVEVDPETVGQYTGLTDKNGNRIFEGDIIEGHCHSQWSHRLQRCVVAYERDGFEARHYVMQGGEECYYTYKVLFSKDVVVIGNITDSPELLKGGESND